MTIAKLFCAKPKHTFSSTKYFKHHIYEMCYYLQYFSNLHADKETKTNEIIFHYKCTTQPQQ